MHDVTLKRCLQALAARPEAVVLDWRSSLGADEVVVYCHKSDVSKIVGRGGKTLNAIVRIGRVLVAPNGFCIPEVREHEADSQDERPYTYDEAVALLRDVCSAAFRKPVTVRTEEENLWMVTVDGEVNRRTAAGTASAIIDLFEAIGLTIGLRGSNRLRIQINSRAE